MNKYYAIVGLVMSLFFTTTSLLAQRNCGSFLFHKDQMEHNNDYAKARKAIEKQTKSFIFDESTARAAVTIPVVVHIVWRTGFPTENISDAQVLSQIDALNKDFSLQNSNAASIPAAFLPIASNTGITFCLAKRTPQNTVTTGINRLQSNRTTNWGTNDEVKLPNSGGFATWDPSKYLNIYVCNIGGGILGYSPYPGAPAQNDGVVIDYRYFGTTGIVSPPYHLGRTATHEIGHWLNLDHIWGDAICGNDSVADTPVHEDANTGCPAYPKYNTCSTNPEMPMNYMDYSDDACMSMFTVGQNARMQAVLAPNGFRNSLLFSDACQPLTSTVSCGVPSGLLLNTITPNSATVSWTALSGATSYDVSYKTATATTWTKVSSSSNTLLISALEPSMAYQFQVQANCNGTFGQSSTPFAFTTLVLPCPAPTNLSFSGITANSASISWLQTNNITLSTLKYRKQGTTTWTSLTATSTNQSIANLLPSTVYEVQILSACGTTTATPLSGTFTTAALAQGCGIATSVAVNTIAVTTANIVWTAVTGATSYRVFYKTTNANIWSSSDTGTNSFLLSALLPATNYQVKIATLCNGQIGNDSQILAFVTKSIPCGNIPTNVGVSGITATTAAVNWTAAVGAVSYKLQYRKSNSTTWTVIGTVFGTTYNLPNLTPLTPYDVQVAAVCGINATSGFSTQKSFLTLGTISSCTDKYEDNNTKSSAKVLLPNSTISANIGSATDNDWFKFANTSAQRYIKLTLSNIPLDYQIRLYDSNFTLIAEGISSSAVAKALKWNNGKVGSFYIQIFSKNAIFSTQNCYELKIETSANVFKSYNKESADNQEVANDFSVEIAPNPVHEYAKISISADKNMLLDYTMFDLTGKTIRADKFDVSQDNNSFYLDTDNVENGIYFLRFNYEDRVVTKKIIVQK
jgi:hypothetical protein